MDLMASQLFFCFILFPACPCLSDGTDTLLAIQYLSGDQTLVSAGGSFRLGFFRPGGSSNHYIGIWYNKVNTTPVTVVWVANRETPISDRFSSKLQIVDGNLVISNGSNHQVWSTNMVSTVTRTASVVLLDDGNLVLRYGSGSRPPIWQSFDHPTNTFLPGGKLGYNKQRSTKQIISSWKSTEDPAVGLFSLEIDQNQKQFLLKWNGSVDYWTSGAWNGQRFSLVPEMRLNYIYNFSFVDNPSETYFTYSLYNTSISSRLILDVSGQIKQLSWLETTGWNLFWSQPRTQCEVHAYCGKFGICSQDRLPFCNCLTAFEPASQSAWNLSDFSGGCVRKRELNCSVKEGNQGFVISHVRDAAKFNSLFLGNRTTLVYEWACRSSCLYDCNCHAYTFQSGKCGLWNGADLDNMSLEFVADNSTVARIPVYIKLDSSDLLSTAAKVNTKVLVAGILSGLFGLVLLCSIGFIFYRRSKRRGPAILSEEDRKSLDVPFFEFKRILSATENFSLSNKLGQGGFGPVYKGILPGVGEIAVKRLSSHSGQGLKEFKNEVVLIAKLQHRNLVRLLGYSMKDHEMILLYEYMPNKSLDHFIFDRTLCMCLDWDLRFDIIMGIARGLLYLHQDSRLRIIHRDLKASNVLLDEEMNPKISDFGLAKIVKGRETEANTSKISGTYGYMSPEYALHGLFSIKSDVFSFGVMLLEIISGKRNTGYYHNQQSYSLISWAWSLWKDKKPLKLLDPALAETCNSIEVLRCMVVGLLCIQEDPQDRPTTTDVIMMLGTDVESLPDPKEPAFVSKIRVHSLTPSSSISDINQMTITEEEGR